MIAALRGQTTETNSERKTEVSTDLLALGLWVSPGSSCRVDPRPGQLPRISVIELLCHHCHFSNTFMLHKMQFM